MVTKDPSGRADFIKSLIFAVILGWISFLVNILLTQNKLFEDYGLLILSLGWFISGLIVGFIRPKYLEKRYFILGFAIISPLIIIAIMHPYSHNLLPLELLFYVICMIPGLVGICLGIFIKNRTTGIH